MTDISPVADVPEFPMARATGFRSRSLTLPLSSPAQPGIDKVVNTNRNTTHNFEFILYPEEMSIKLDRAFHSLFDHSRRALEFDMFALACASHLFRDLIIKVTAAYRFPIRPVNKIRITADEKFGETI